MLNNNLIGNVTEKDVNKILKVDTKLKQKSCYVESLNKKGVSFSQTGKVIFSDYKPLSGLKKAIKLGGEKTIKEVRSSNIKGRGGAGFTTGDKWQFASEAYGENKYIICNADEGEPGTFKDRILITNYAHLIIEGMTIAGHAIGAEKGYVYLRYRYINLKPYLEKAIANFKKQKALGKNILGSGFNFDIEIKIGAGAYICGEETALIESMEGQRGEPRNKPPFPANSGYYGQPTVINNVETLCAVSHILAKGAKWFKKFGTEKSSGTKVLSISGDCKKPGVYEVEFGTTINQILKLAKATNTKAVQVGGASGVCIKKGEFNRKIAFEDVPTGGAITIFNNNRNITNVAQNFLQFFEEESCGQCSPCREGMPVLLDGLKDLKKGKCNKNYLHSLISLTETMRNSSKCGLGQTAPNIFVDLVTKFKKDYKLSKTVRKEEEVNV
ncbi:MAG: dehydrogenase [Elusimicrobiaceae bacterium]|nr:dehydrogenase [Elusimicrobiaceae bacterium]MBT3954978.1 dehydrogenase [Elusimicrobiaceae bacterium]MBT4008130.1 dehydrogenase [Elusimicrobiaceae bacterium]MBT4402674.1 dehydrogenase [Elusimicrobiaceae bacterium]MBT4440042.1 dehydrogenase [Elusimicrobiaceae bacterium]